MSDISASRKTFISFSGGVESTTMCILFGGVADAVFADTGWEHKILYQHIAKVEEAVQKLHRPDFQIFVVKGQATIHGVTVDNLPDYIRAARYAPGPMSRYCTKYFKIWPVDEFLRRHGEVDLMIGMNADEADRTGNHGNEANVNYRYPLIENGITRDGCIKILEAADLLPKFPPYMKRGGCIGCFFKSVTEYEAMALLSPDEADAVAELEDDMQDDREKRYGIRDGIPDMGKFVENARSQQLIPVDEMYDWDRYESIHTPCGAFCHR